MSHSSQHSQLLYSEASRAFILQDFERTKQLLADLSVERASRQPGSSSSSSSSDADLVRKVWILEITLLSSTATDIDEAAKVALLEDLYSRIKRHYVQSDPASTGVIVDDSDAAAPLHPSLIVALSLSAIKLGLPGYSRRILDEYFDVLLYTPQEHVSALAHSHSSITPSASTNGDLSISEIALPPRSLNASTTSSVLPTWDKALHRLARVYAVLILGKAFQEWAAARHWVTQQRDETAGVQLVTHESSRELLDELDVVQAAYEREQAELELERARQSELDKKAAKGNSTSATASSSRKSRITQAASNSKRKTTTGASVASSDRKSTRNGDSHVDAMPQAGVSDTTQSGFAALRDRLSAALPISSDSLTSSSSHNLASSSSILAITTSYLGKLAESRLFSSVLVFFFILAVWRRRARLQIGKRRLQVLDLVRRMRDKVVETVKMGGSLGLV